MTLVDKKTIQIGKGILIDIDPDAEYVQMRMVSGKTEVKERVKKSDLYAAIFHIADPKTQDAMMPVRQTQVMTFERIHNIQVKKDMRKGQIIKVRCHVDVPTRIEENLRGLVADAKAAVNTVL
jgi:hypothetical protein